MIARDRFVIVAAAAALAGCAAPYTETPPPDSHPANPGAPAAPMPERSGTLDLSRPELAPAAGAAAAPAGQADGEYTCPMHPEVGSATEGRCPICRMKLVKKEGGKE